MPRKAASAAGAKRAAPRAHALPEEFPRGMLLKDLCKKEWHLGKVLGQGGFGLIYLASEASKKSTDDRTETYVIKIEPKGNGPLFCEAHFYQKVAKIEFIEDFVRAHRLKYLGVPPYVGTGLEKYKLQDYRFLVMPRLGTDLQKLLLKSGGVFEHSTTLAIALRMVDALQFLHEKEYVHADIKAANILLGFSKGRDIPNEVYLVDFGLAYRYTVGGEHKVYKEDLKMAHNGTIEFTSRDAHKGLAPSRRGDLEILGYCMLQWLSGQLPWGNKLTNPSYVAESKESFMDNLQTQLFRCIPKSSNISGCIYNYFDHVKKLEYHSEPNYNLIRDILKTGLAKSGQKDEWVINFTVKGEKRKLAGSDSTDDTSSSSASPKKSPRYKNKSPRGRQSPKGRQSPGPSDARKAVKKSSSKSGNANFNKTTSPSSGKGKAPILILSSSPSPGKGNAPTFVLSSSSQQPTSLPTLNGKAATRFTQPKKHFPMPAPTKPSPANGSRSSPRRVVRRVVAQSDTSVQTSPGLLYNN